MFQSRHGGDVQGRFILERRAKIGLELDSLERGLRRRDGGAKRRQTARADAGRRGRPLRVETIDILHGRQGASGG